VPIVHGGHPFDDGVSPGTKIAYDLPDASGHWTQQMNLNAGPDGKIGTNDDASYEKIGADAVKKWQRQQQQEAAASAPRR
jgi:hypothetical protein